MISSSRLQLLFFPAEAAFSERITSAGLSFLPPDFSKDRPAPLVFVLHGGGGEGRRFDQSVTQGTLTAAADQQGVVLVFPEGVNKQWYDGRTEMLKSKKTYNDVGFISKIIDTMVKKYGNTDLDIKMWKNGVDRAEEAA